MNNRFLTLDLEMANDNITSVCQVGLAIFENGNLTDTWESLIKPDGDFGYYQTRVHGITKDDVQFAPKLIDVADQLRNFIEDQVVFSYGMSDCSALMDSLPLPKCTWSDASIVARKVWNYGKNRRKLQDACADHNIALLNNHNALADAIATGELMLQAMIQNNRDVNFLLNHSRKLITTKSMEQVGLF